jgi:hypothetical protein
MTTYSGGSMGGDHPIACASRMSKVAAAGMPEWVTPSVLIPSRCFGFHLLGGNVAATAEGCVGPEQ